jgi:hypothetical protein
MQRFAAYTCWFLSWSLLGVVSLAAAQEHQVGEMRLTAADAERVFKKPGYSPYAGRQFPTRVFWGDTHLHTDNSLDARAFGVTIGPDDAYRLARGDEVLSSHGERVKLSRPLDFLVVSDHSDGMGAMKEIVAGNPDLLRDATVKDWHLRVNEGGQSALAATMDIINSFALGNIPEILQDDEFARTIWDDYVKLADNYNDPGTFTAIIGYEWTSTEDGNNLHRNVLYRDAGDKASRMLPYTTSESFNPEDLWNWMATYEEETGGKVLAIPHNGNLSNGIMFPVERNPDTGKRLDDDYVKNRIRWEPVYEITQIKGDGETHPVISPEDEFADYETWDKGNLNLSTPKTDAMLEFEYARSALRNGLKMEEKLGANPYKFGVIGSTDSHTALATAEEENFFGKHSGVEPSEHRVDHIVGGFGDKKYYSWDMAASGYAAVWATRNTREGIFDALMRKEVYATTGPRMLVRFFGGWDFQPEDAMSRMPGEVGYTKGVPMGGNLSAAPSGQAPAFLVGAMKDPLSGNLDRIQIVKGWMDRKGKTHEKVYDVVWGDAGTRQPAADGKLPAVGNTVNVEKATWLNTIGDPELIAVWSDPDFDPKHPAFYYARVIEIPTPRWTAYDAARYGVSFPAHVEMTTQERAYTTPIWYTP